MGSSPARCQYITARRGRYAPQEGSSSVKKYATLTGVLLTVLLILAFTQAHASTQAQSSSFPVTHPTVVPLAPSGSYVVTGTPTISASFINRVLAAYGSPARGHGQALYSLGVKYGIDPSTPWLSFSTKAGSAPPARCG